MDAEVVKALKQIQEQINDLYSRQEEFLLAKHEDNSNAIDDLTIAMLEKETADV